MGFITVEHDHRARMYVVTRRGLKQGMAEGRKKGLEAFASLTDKLLDAGRIDDLKRATHDELFRQVLFEEFQID